jgi:predicted transcriptional regulator
MKTTDPRNMTFVELESLLEGLRAEVYEAMLNHCGPTNNGLTTRGLANIIGIDLLTVRPRVCELVQLGFAECVGHTRRGRSHEGVYRAVPRAVIEQQCAERAAKGDLEPELALGDLCPLASAL